MTSKSHTNLPWKKSLNLVCHPWLDTKKINKSPKNEAELKAIVVFKNSQADVKKALKSHLEEHEIKKVLDSKTQVGLFQRPNNYLLVLQPLKKFKNKTTHSSELPTSEFAHCRDIAGSLMSVLKQKDIGVCEVILDSAKKLQTQGFLTGLEMAKYNFKASIKGEKKNIDLYISKSKGTITTSELNDSIYPGIGVNLARHLVNLPSNWLYPQTYAELVIKLFQGVPNVTVKTWGEADLKKNNMGMMLAVGCGSYHEPMMVHIKYRPTKGKPPIAVIGKGITFDTGGSDLKPSAGMRLMKKDMGGSATCVGLAYALTKMKSKQSFDIYLALAENSLDGASFVASDIIQAANGMTVEIHNTDAEGRLVVGDVMHIATSKKGKDKPKSVIDVCTLTGAIKVGLGADIAGLFSNNDALAKKLQSGCDYTSERAWRMPLFAKYKTKLRSHSADMTNCASSGFGGAITAALFLQEFTNEVPWAHFDIYAWNESPRGALLDIGGSGQMVQSLVQSLK